MEAREAQRLERYITPSQSGYGGRVPPGGASRYSRSTSATVSEDRRDIKPTGNDKTADRQQANVAGRREPMVTGQVSREKPGFSVDNGRSRTSPAVGQYQHQPQNSNLDRHTPAAAAAVAARIHQHPVQSPHLPTSAQSTNYLAPRQSGQLPQTASKTARDDPVQDNRDRSPQFHQRSTSYDPRIVAQSRGYPEPQTGMVTGVTHERNRPQGAWRQPSYEAGDARNGARLHSRPESTSGARTATLPSKIVDPYRQVQPARDDRGSYRTSSSSSSQPDLLRYLDPAYDRFSAPRPAGEPSPQQSYPPPPSHSRSASNPIVLRAQGSSPSSTAVASLFAYHQKSTPDPAPAPSPPGSQSTEYVPPAVAVQHISMQARSRGAPAPAKPPRISLSSSLDANPYDYRRQDSDSQGHAEYTQQVGDRLSVVCV